MIKLLLIIGLIPYSLAFVMYMPHFIKEFSYVKGQLFWFSLASTCLFIGQGQMFSHETYMSNTSVYDVGMIYQISWMVSGGIILTVLLARNGYSQNAERLPIIMLAIYGILGVITSVYSPAPLYSTYKSMQVLLDFMLVATAVNLLVKHKRPDLLLNLTIFLLSFVIMSAAAGGIFLPELAYHELYGGGAFGHTLNSVFPEVHSNELGLLSSCLVVVSLRRMAEDVQTKLCRYYWMSLGVLSLMVLIGAQARTSIAALTISIVVMAYFIPKLRWLSYCIAILQLY